MYEALILIAATADIDLRSFEEAIEARFAGYPEVSSEISGSRLTLSVDGFHFFINYNCAESVSIESQEIAEMFASGRDDADQIAGAKCRFEVSSDDDPSMDHFNDFVFLMEAAEQAGTVFLFDPAAGSFI